MNAKAPIIVDGANVAHWHGRQKQFSCRGLLICLAFFKTRGHNNVYVILPQRWQTKSDIGDLIDGQLLTELYKSKIISYAPAGTSDDDFIIHLSQKYNAIIVTNDQFRMEQNLRPDLKSFVVNRLLTYTFVHDDFIPNPHPLGTKNPMSLEFFLTGYHLGTAVEQQNQMSNADLLKLVLNPQNNDSSPNQTKNNQHMQKPKAMPQVVGQQNNNKKNKNKDPNKNQTKQSGDIRRAGNPKKPFASAETKNVKGRQSGSIGLPLPDATPMPPSPQPVNLISLLGRPSTTFDQELFSLVKQQQQQSLSPTSPTGAIPKQKVQNKKEESSNPRLVYCLGIVMEIHTGYGQIESTNVKNKIIFYANAYQTECNDLTMKFSKGKTVAFGYPPLKPGMATDVSQAIEASVVCPADELVRGYGKITGDINFHGITVIPYPVLPLAQVYCPANTFIHKNLQLKDLNNENWVDFLAMPQYPLGAKRPYVSVNTVLARTEGVVIKVDQSNVYAWSRLVGFVAFHRSSLSQSMFPEQAFKLGVWLEFQLDVAPQGNDSNCLWHGSDVKIIMPKVPTTFSADGSVVLSSLHGYAGSITQSFGNIYSNTVGRIAIESECLKRCESLCLAPMQKVLVGARFSNPPNLKSYKYAWVAIEVLPYKFSNRNKSDLRLMVKDVVMTVDKNITSNGNVSYLFFKTDKFGPVFAESFDCSRTFDTWKHGDIVRGSIITEELPQKNWRAFYVDKI